MYVIYFHVVYEESNNALTGKRINKESLTDALLQAEMTYAFFPFDLF